MGTGLAARQGDCSLLTGMADCLGSRDTCTVTMADLEKTASEELNISAIQGSVQLCPDLLVQFPSHCSQSLCVSAGLPGLAPPSLPHSGPRQASATVFSPVPHLGTPNHLQGTPISQCNPTLSTEREMEEKAWHSLPTLLHLEEREDIFNKFYSYRRKL